MRQKIYCGFLFLLLAVLACRAPAGTTPTPPVSTPGLPTPAGTAPPLSATAVPLPTPETVGNPFAPFDIITPSVTVAAPQYILDPAGAANATLLTTLNSDQQAALASQGFVIVPQPFPTLAAVYARAGVQETPIFITSDSILYAVHTQLAVARQQAEENGLAADLLTLSLALSEASAAQYEQTADLQWSAAARWNLAFFSVGARLLDPDFVVPPAVADLVADELTLIQNAAGTFISPLQGIPADYTRYALPTDRHLTEPQQRFRQAMTWYGQISWPLDPADPGTARDSARRILLVAAALQSSENLSRWERLFVSQQFLRGTAGGLSMREVQAAATAVYGELPGTPQASSPAELDSFITTLQAAGRPTFRFLPQMLAADRPFLAQLVFNQVGVYTGSAGETLPFTAAETAIGPVRALPRGLDIAAVAGSATALAFLETAGDTTYNGYDQQLNTLQATYTARPEESWTETLDGGWLYGLQSLLPLPAPGLPSFMSSPAWQAKALNSWYGGWALLHHEPQLVPQAVTTTPLPAPAAYVEPVPALYARLAALTRQTFAGLDGRGLLDKDLGEQLLRMARLLDLLQVVSEKELRGEAPTAEEASTLASIGEALVTLTTFTAPTGGTLSTPALPFVVDAFHNPQHGLWLQAAVGEAWPIYVLVPIEDQLVIAVGAVFSSYEFARPGNERFTLETWQNNRERGEPAGWLTGALIP